MTSRAAHPTNVEDVLAKGSGNEEHDEHPDVMACAGMLAGLR
jgi:hypothetical protein